MKRIAIVVLALMAVFAWHSPSRSGAATPTAAPTGTPNSAAPTISAYETQVSALEATVAIQQTQITKRDDKIDALRTKVAVYKAQVPTATADLAESGGQDGAHVDGWIILPVGTEFSSVAAGGSSIQTTARGVYFFVYLTITNNASSPKVFPYADLRVKDSRGRTFSLDWDATGSEFIVANTGIPSQYEFQPGIPTAFTAIFDVATDAHGFTLTSSGEAFKFPLDK